MTRLPDEAWRSLMHSAADREADERELARLSAEIEADPARAREFARLMMLDDAIERSMHAGAPGRVAARSMRLRRHLGRMALLAASVAIAVGAAWLAFGIGRSASATDLLTRLAGVARSGDRTYLVSVPDGLRTTSPSRQARPREPGVRPEPSIDGAVLSLRGSDRYVLARVDDEGRRTLTGCDGSIAWSIGPNGRVRTSRDLARFQGAIPGSRHGIAFIDPRDGLEGLAKAYRLSMLAPSPDDPVARLVGERRSGTRGGPKRIEIAYDPESLVIRSMRLDNLPQARGGPRSVELELVDESELPEAFFTFGFHADPMQPVTAED